MRTTKAYIVRFQWEVLRHGPKPYEATVFACSRLRARRVILGRCRGSRITRVLRARHLDGVSVSGALSEEKNG